MIMRMFVTSLVAAALALAGFLLLRPAPQIVRVPVPEPVVVRVPEPAPAPEPIVVRVPEAAPAPVAVHPPPDWPWTDPISRAQASLNALGVAGAPLAVDGVRGPLTAAALRAFQTAQGLPADGRLTPRTRAALVRALAARRNIVEVQR
jgi:hypothetical protein